ncbi:GMC family oxidoreductase [Halovenus sp. HT40]|uniref:GMC family oxidoreductase n=1 Tax=Halovenus sp. HT40 TaxID=3126691 RepID=UPI00300F15FE
MSNQSDRTPSERVDLCLVGAGIAGAIVAAELAERGFDVVLLESGERFDPDDRLAQMEQAIRPEHDDSEIWNMGGPRDRFSSSGAVEYALNDRRVKGVGGTTLHWLGTTPRLHPRDFELNSRYGIGTDWPISYDDLRPYYAQAEREMGIAGGQSRSAPPREVPYPMDPFPETHSDGLFESACEELGISMRPCPQARNSEAYDGRSECVGYGTCIPVCPSGAKYSGDVHVRKAEDHGAKVIDRVTVEYLEHGPDSVEAARYVTPDGTRHRQEARHFVVAAGGVETPRLLLLSQSEAYPDGLANSSGLVGRYFMEHPAVRTTARIDQETNPEPVRFLTRISEQFYEGADGPPGSILLKFGNPNPDSPVDHALSEPDADSLDGIADAVTGTEWGDDLLDGYDGVNHTLWIGGNLEMLPDKSNRVKLDPNTTDKFGNPVPDVSFSVGSYATQTAEEALDIQREILETAGGEVTSQTDPTDPNFLSHHLGTTRMGTDPETSVVDSRLRTHDIENLWCVSSSVFPTAGAANPTLTIGALALRTSEFLAEQL